jgi:hypothetical protein
MMDNHDEFPHSIALWVHWELHQRRPDGRLEGSPKEQKKYNGAIHFNNRKEALDSINSIMEKLKEELENANGK